MAYTKHVTIQEASEVNDPRVETFRVTPTIFTTHDRKCKVNIEIVSSEEDAELLLLEDDNVIEDLWSGKKFEGSFSISDLVKNEGKQYALGLRIDDEILSKKFLFDLSKGGTFSHSNVLFVDDDSYHKRMQYEDSILLTTDDADGPNEYAICGDEAKLKSIRYNNANFKGYLYEVEVQIKNDSGEVVETANLKIGDEYELQQPQLIKTGLTLTTIMRIGKKPFPVGSKLRYEHHIELRP